MLDRARQRDARPLGEVRPPAAGRGWTASPALAPSRAGMDAEPPTGPGPSPGPCTTHTRACGGRMTAAILVGAEARDVGKRWDMGLTSAGARGFYGGGFRSLRRQALVVRVEC